MSPSEPAAPPARGAAASGRRRCGPEPGIAKSKAGRWRALVLLLVHVAIAIHVAQWMLTGSTATPVEPSEAMEFTKDGVVNVGLIFFGVAIVLTGVFGRWFCGWACHLVAIQDGTRWLLGKVGIRPRMFRSRVLLLVPYVAFVYMFLYPLWYRFRHDLGFEVQEARLTTEEFWATFPPWPIAILTLVVAGAVIIYFLGAKGFCTYACPYGAIFSVADRFSPGRIRVNDACEGCGHCTAVCSSNVVVHAEVRDYGAVVDAGCMKCLDCVSVCPNDALHFEFGRPEVATGPRAGRPGRAISRWKWARWSDFTWWEELAILAFGVLAFVSFRGLYGSIPFLFSLSIAAILAYLGIQTLRLFYRRNLNVQRWVVKRNGRLTGAGVSYVAGFGLLAVFWGHSFLIQAQARAVDAGWEAAAEQREAWYSNAAGELSADERRSVERTLAACERLERLALVRDPRLPGRMATLHALLGDEPEFERRMAAWIERQPGSVSARLTLGDYHGSRGRVEAAFRHYAAAIELDPDDPRPQERLGALAQVGGRLPAARALLARAREAHPESAGLAFQLGVVSSLLGEAEPALELFREALRLDPESLAARENLASGLLFLGRLPEAVEQYEELLARRPDDLDAHFQLAQAVAGLGDFERAERHLLEVTAGDPELALAWLFLGQVVEAQGDAQRAREYFERAARLQAESGAEPPR